MSDWLLLFFAAALMLMLVGALAFHRRWPGARRRRVPMAANAVPAPAGASADGAAEVLEYLRRLEAQGSPGLVTEVIAIFLKDTSIRLTALRHAVAQRDGEAVYRVAHTLQGSASMIGAASVAHTCDALTKSARGGSFDRCKVLVAELDARFEAIQRAIAS